MISLRMEKALEGLAELVKKSGAELVGAGVVIEKGFPGRRRYYPFQRYSSGVAGNRRKHG